MFNLRYPDGAALKKIFYGTLKPLSEVPIRVDSSSLTVRGLSPDKNILVEIYVPSTAFETYDISAENLITGDRDEFLKVVRRATKKDVINLRWEDGAESMFVSLINTKTGTERTYRVRVLETGKELIQSLELDLPVKVQIASEDLRKIISDAKLVGEELNIAYKDGSLEVSCRSEGKEFRETLSVDKPLLGLESKESTVTSRYDVDLLRTLAPALDAADVAVVEFGAGLPLKLSLTTDDGSRITAWVAPRA